MMSLWDALRMNMMISYQELVRTFLSAPVHVNVMRKQQNTSVGNAAGPPVTLAHQSHRRQTLIRLDWVMHQ